MNPRTATGGFVEHKADQLFKRQPGSIKETGVGLTELVDLCVKAIHFAGQPSARSLGEHLALPYNVLEELLSFLKKEQIIEIAGTDGTGEQAYLYALTDNGREKVVEALDRNAYVGPCPVPFAEYVDVVKRQALGDDNIPAAVVNDALSGLQLSATTRGLIGPAVNSGRSLLLYGEPGNGKSAIAKGIGRMMTDNVLIPYAIDVNGQIIRLFDSRVHEVILDAPVTEERRNLRTVGSFEARERRHDRRWAICRRPVVMAGGELTLSELELRYSPQAKFYIAPLQMQANCGVLVIDDFGRQLIGPKALLNRWIVPMEERIDHLALANGEVIEVPFELLLVFSTNIPPDQLGDEAFFRRIRHKIEVGDPDEESFKRILKSVCEGKNIAFSDEAAEYLVENYYRHYSRPFRGVAPRNLVDLIADISRFEGRPPALDRQSIDLACASYFIAGNKSLQPKSDGPFALAS